MPHWGRPPGIESTKSHGHREKRVVFENGRESTDEDGTNTLAIRNHGIGKGVLAGENRSYLRSEKNFKRGSNDSIESAGSYISSAQQTFKEKKISHLQSALTRIRRAQEKGKSDVKLSQEELTALEIRRKQLQNTARLKDEQETESEDEERQKIAVPLSSFIISDQSAFEPHRRENFKKSGESELTLASGSHSSSSIIKGPDGKLYAPLESLDNLQTSSRSFVPHVDDTNPPYYDQIGFNRAVTNDIRQAFSNGSYSSKFDRSPVSSRSSFHNEDPFNYLMSATTSVPHTHRNAQQASQGPPESSFSPNLRTHTSTYNINPTEITEKRVKGRETEEYAGNEFDYKEAGPLSESEFSTNQSSKGTPPTRRSTRKRRPVKGY